MTDKEILKIDFYDLCGIGSIGMTDSDKLKYYKSLSHNKLNPNPMKDKLTELVEWMEGISILDDSEDVRTVYIKAKQLQQEQEEGWISVEDDKKPKEGQSILIFHDGFVSFGMYGKMHRHRKKAKPQFLISNADWDGGPLPAYNSTHWQPLPEPPKKVDWTKTNMQGEELG